MKTDEPMKRIAYSVVVAILFSAVSLLSSCVKDGLDGRDGREGREGARGEPGAPGSVVTIGKVDGEWWWYIDGMKTDYKVKGASGNNGAAAAVVTIIDGYWAFDGVKSEHKAIGENGLDGENIVAIEISPDGYWIINGEKTDVKTKGEDGKDGSTVEVRDDGFLWIDGVKTDIQVYECKLKTFTLTFFLDSNDTEPYLTQVVMEEAWPGIPSKIPSLPQKTFEYWYAAGTSDEFDFDAPVTSDVTLYAMWVAGYKNNAPIKLWQTHIASPEGIHEWDDIEAEYTVTRLPELPMRTGWGFTDGKDLIFADQPNGWRLFKYTNNYTAWEYTNAQIPRFQSMTHEFLVDRGFLYAIPFSSPDPVIYDNKRIQISGAAMLTYAQYNNDVIAITNWGEILVFRNNEWYRMTRVQNTDVWVITPGAGMLPQASGKQFYCSIIYQGRTLIGEYPTGKIYEFTGSVLQVSDISPPAELLRLTPGFEGDYKEAQSMAIYGGDLFVGYWPDGVILRYDYKQKQWSRFTRLFDFPTEGNFRDYYAPEHVTAGQINFYGQRVQSLVPFEDGLYAVTSNKNTWYDYLVPSPLLTEEQIKQYGAVYKIYRPGCRTTYFPR